MPGGTNVGYNQTMNKSIADRLSLVACLSVACLSMASCGEPEGPEDMVMEHSVSIGINSNGLFRPFESGDPMEILAAPGGGFVFFFDALSTDIAGSCLPPENSPDIPVCPIGIRMQMLDGEVISPDSTGVVILYDDREGPYKIPLLIPLLEELWGPEQEVYQRFVGETVTVTVTVPADDGEYTSSVDVVISI